MSTIARDNPLVPTPRFKSQTKAVWSAKIWNVPRAHSDQVESETRSGFLAGRIFRRKTVSTPGSSPGQVFSRKCSKVGGAIRVPTPPQQ
jgi:F420-0:gamma-glutamyl ligase-like protein